MKDLISELFSANMRWVTGMAIVLVIILGWMVYTGISQDAKVIDDFNDNYIVLENKAGTMICSEKTTGNVYHIHTQTEFTHVKFIVDSPVYDASGRILNVNK